MKKGLIIIADSNPSGPGHKLILPTLRYIYAKSDYKYQIIDLYRDDFNPMFNSGITTDGLTKSYMHSIKTASEIHFISNTHLNGISAGLEGFFERVLKDRFAYNRSGRNRMSLLKSKDTYFYITHSVKRNRFNPLWFRIKFIIGKLFKSCKVYQFHPDKVTKVGNKEFKMSFDKMIRKWLETNRNKSI
jgi:putative NADPH-quinone reductase